MPLTAILLAGFMAQAPGATPAARDIREILRNGDLAALTATLDQGTTPLDVARREGNAAIIALLEGRGAKGGPPRRPRAAATSVRSPRRRCRSCSRPTGSRPGSGS